MARRGWDGEGCVCWAGREVTVLDEHAWESRFRRDPRSVVLGRDRVVMWDVGGHVFVA